MQLSREMNEGNVHYQSPGESNRELVNVYWVYRLAFREDEKYHTDG